MDLGDLIEALTNTSAGTDAAVMVMLEDGSLQRVKNVEAEWHEDTENYTVWIKVEEH